MQSVRLPWLATAVQSKVKVVSAWAPRPRKTPTAISAALRRILGFFIFIEGFLARFLSVGSARLWGRWNRGNQRCGIMDRNRARKDKESFSSFACRIRLFNDLPDRRCS